MPERGERKLPHSSAQLDIAFDVLNSMPEHFPIYSIEIPEIAAEIMRERELAAADEATQAALVEPLQKQLDDLSATLHPSPRKKLLRTLQYWPYKTPESKEKRLRFLTHQDETPEMKAVFERNHTLTTEPSASSHRDWFIRLETLPEGWTSHPITGKDGVKLVGNNQEIVLPDFTTGYKEYFTGIVLHDYTDSQGRRRPILSIKHKDKYVEQQLIPLAGGETGEEQVIHFRKHEKVKSREGKNSYRRCTISPSLYPGMYALKFFEFHSGNTSEEPVLLTQYIEEKISSEAHLPKLPEALANYIYTHKLTEEASLSSKNSWTVRTLSGEEQEQYDYPNIKSRQPIFLAKGEEIKLSAHSKTWEFMPTGIYLSDTRHEGQQYFRFTVKSRNDQVMADYFHLAEAGGDEDEIIVFQKNNNGQKQFVRVRQSNFNPSELELRLMRRVNVSEEI